MWSTAAAGGHHRNCSSMAGPNNTSHQFCFWLNRNPSMTPTAPSTTSPHTVLRDQKLSVGLDSYSSTKASWEKRQTGNTSFVVFVFGQIRTVCTFIQLHLHSLSNTYRQKPAADHSVTISPTFDQSAMTRVGKLVTVDINALQHQRHMTQTCGLDTHANTHKHTHTRKDTKPVLLLRIV